MLKSKIAVSICAAALSLAVLSGCKDKAADASSNGISQNDIPTAYISGSFTIDVNNPAEVVGDADYVFAAAVNEIAGTEYKDPVSIETESGSQEVGDPYTNYKVTVTDNIKGELRKDIEIELQKYGGLSPSKNQYILFEGDGLPKAGETYIFIAYAQEDGSLLVSGPNSNILLNTENREELLAEYEEAYKSQIETARDRSVSKYDAGVK